MPQCRQQKRPNSEFKVENMPDNSPLKIVLIRCQWRSQLGLYHVTVCLMLKVAS